MSVAAFVPQPVGRHGSCNNEVKRYMHGAEGIGKHHNLTTGIVYRSHGFTLRDGWRVGVVRGSIFNVRGAIVDF